MKRLRAALTAMLPVRLDCERRRDWRTKALVAALSVVGVVTVVGAWIALSPLYRLALEGSPVPLPPSGLAGGLFFMSVTAPVLAWVLLLLLGLLLAGLLVALCGVPFLIAARAIWNKRPPLEGQTAGERDAAPS